MPTSLGTCEPASCARVALGTIAVYSTVLWLSRHVISPGIAPITYKRLAKQPGQQGYWDSCVASSVNGMVNTILVIATVRREPRLLSLKDANFVNDDTCFMVVLFMAWCAIDLAQVFYYRWKGQIGTIVHHGSAFIAWGLYLEGGYGHALSLVGVFCEATNPFMNMRYFLSEAGLKSHPAYMINGGLFCLSWLFVRLSFAIPLGTWMIASQWGSLACVPPAPMRASLCLPPDAPQSRRRARAQRAADVAPVFVPGLLFRRLRSQRHLGVQALPRRL